MDAVMRMPRLYVALCLLIAASTVSSADAQESVTLRLKPSVGQVRRYRMVSLSWIRIPGMPLLDTIAPTIAETLYTTLTSAARDSGKWTTSTVVDSSSVSMMGRANPGGGFMRGTVIRQTWDSLGHVDSTEVIPAAGVNAGMAERLRSEGLLGGGSLGMPDRAVRVGESWSDSTSRTVSDAAGKRTLRAWVTYRLDSVEHNGAHRVAVVSSQMTISADALGASASGKGTGAGSYRLDLDAGQLLAASTDVTMDISANTVKGSSRAHTAIDLLGPQ